MTMGLFDVSNRILEKGFMAGDSYMKIDLTIWHHPTNLPQPYIEIKSRRLCRVSLERDGALMDGSSL